MELSLQIQIGLYLSALLSFFLMFFLKKSRIVWVSFCLFCIVSALLIRQIQSLIPNRSVQKQEEIQVSSETMFRFAYTLACLEGEQKELSMEVLDEYLETHEYSDAFVLAKARCCALIEKNEEAKALYQLLIDKESTILSKKQLESENTAIGDSTDVNTNPIILAVKEEINKCGEEEQSFVNAFVELQKEKQEESIAKSNLKEIKSHFDQAQEKAMELCSIELVQKAELEINYLMEDYGVIIDNTYKYQQCEDIIVLSELNRTGKLSSSAILENESIAKEVKSNEETLNWLLKQQEKNTYADKAGELLEEAVQTLKAACEGNSDQQVFYWFENKLLDAASKDSETEKSRIYAQLSRLEYQRENEDKASIYLMKAFNTASESKDPAYSGPVNEINTIISNKDNSEQLKDLYRYAVMMVNNVFEDDLYEISYYYDSDSDALVKQILDIASYSGDTENSVLEGNYEEVAPEDEFGKDTSENETDNSSPMNDSEGEMAFSDEEFAQNISNDASKMAASLNVVNIDATNFEEVSSVIAINDNFISSVEEFKKYIEIYDCGNQITEYEVSEEEYQNINLVLCCDNSGSMAGDKIENLKKALSVFAQNVDGTVNIGVVPFSGDVNTNNIFSLQQAQTFSNSVIDVMQADGGTNIYNGITYSIDMLKGNKNDLNIIVLLSDGQDGEPGDEEQEYLKNAFASNGISLYSMGLGSDVDANLLSLYSDIGGGDYVYIDNANSLFSFYQYIYELCKNRFKITYKAKDTLKTSRYLEVHIKDTQFSDTKEYYLYNQENVSEDELGDPYSVVLKDVTVSGLDTRLMYSSRIDQITYLKGEGLKKEHNISVSLHGNMEYELSSEYVDDTKWQVTVPSEVAVGVYDVYITVDGKRVVFDSGFVMTSREFNIVKFGDYVFSATGMEVLDNSVKMTGYISMNNWLGFHSYVTLDGYENETTPQVVMQCGKTWIQYKEGKTEGFSNFLAKNGVILSLPDLSGVTLYNDPTKDSSSDEYPTEAVQIPGALLIVDLIEINAPGVRLYPDRAEVNFNEFSTKLPFQDKIVKASKSIFKVDGENKSKVKKVDTTALDYNAPSYDADFELKALIGIEGIDCSFSLESSENPQEIKAYKQAGTFGNMPVYLNLTQLKISFDTQKGDFCLQVVTDVAFISDGLGIEISFNSCKLNEVKLYADKEIKTTVSGIPCTFRKFSIGVRKTSDIKKPIDLLSLELSGSCNIEVASISEVLPDIVKKKYMEDMAFLTFDTVTLKFSLAKMYIEMKSNVKLLGWTLGKIGLRMGRNLSYTNLLLSMDDEKISGISATLSLGLEWKDDSDRINLLINGQTEATLSSKVFGITASGDLKASLELWIWVKNFNTNGNIFVGTYQQHNQKWIFGFWGNDNKGNHFDVAWGTPIS